MAVTLNAFTPSSSDLNIDITLVESDAHPITVASHPFEIPIIWGAVDA